MNDIKKVANTVWFHTKVLLKGFKRVLFGALTAGLIAFAVYGFYVIPSEGGWAAVCDFVTAIATMFVALLGVYTMGAGYKKGAKR